MSIKRILTGVRPTGPLHLGHKVGALDNWLILQNEGQYECYFLVADVQALTTHAYEPRLIEQSIRDVLLDWMAVGLNPELHHVNFVLQSGVPERYELSILLQMVTPWSWVDANPTIKTEIKALQNEKVVGFPSYPVDQAADILMVSSVPPSKNDQLLVPVGKDQSPHLELTRRITRRFNKIYKQKVLPECEGLIGNVGRLVGIDGNDKMSKSRGNAIYISDSARVLRQKINRMYTDPHKIHITDPGNVDKHVPFMYLHVFYPDKDEIAKLELDYKKGRIGDVPIKNLLFITLNELLSPIRERRIELVNQLDVQEILLDGTKKARCIAQTVTSSVREAMHLQILKT